MGFNLSRGGLRSMSVGRRGASFNIPVARSGGARTTVGVPGAGLSWSMEHAAAYSRGGSSRSPGKVVQPPPQGRAMRCLQAVAARGAQLELLASGSAGALLWEYGNVIRLLADGSLGPGTAGLLGLIEMPEAMEGCLLRAQHQDDAKRGAQRCIEPLQEALRLRADCRRFP